MATLSFDIKANYEKVVQLRSEIDRLEESLNSVNASTPKHEIEKLESELANARGEFKSLTQAAMEAGAKMESDWKAKMDTAGVALAEVTDRIRQQKDVLQEAEEKVKRFGDAYADAVNKGRGGLIAKQQLDEATESLNREREALDKLVQEQVEAQGSVDKLEKEYAELNGAMGKSTDNADMMTQAFMKMSAALGGINALKNLMGQIVQVRGAFQDMEVSIETLVGKDMTAKLLPQIKEMAKTSPLTMTDIVGAEKTMLSFNINAEKSIEYLKALSDVSMGNSQKFNSLTLAFSQVSSAGKLMGQDLLQMINAGFNPLQQIAKTTGKTISELKDEMSKGKISAEMVQQAFIDATSEGGKFYNMSANASQTINGQISMMEDAWAAALNEIGTQSEGLIMGGIKAITFLIENYEKVGKILLTLVATYGAYKAAVITTVAAENVASAIKTGAITKTGLYTLAVEKLKNAFIKLKAVQTSTWIGLAAAGITALVGTIWSFSESAEDATAAQEGLNDALAEGGEAAEGQASKIEKLIRVVQDETKATEDRTAALIKLKNEYPEIFDKYDLEAMKLTEIRDLMKEVNEAEREKSYATTYSEASNKAWNYDVKKQEFEKNKDKYKEEGILGKKTDELNAAYNAAKEASKKFISEQLQPMYAQALSELDTQTISEIFRGEKSLADITGFDATKEMWSFLSAEEKAEFNKIISQELSTRGAKVKYSDAFALAEKEWKEASSLLEKMKLNKEEYSVEDYGKAEQNLKKKKEEFEKLGGETGKKTTKNTETDYASQTRTAQKNATKQAIRQQQELDNQLEQARIDTLQDGAEKRAAQIALNNKLELEQLERSKEDFVAAYVARQKTIFEAEERERAAKNPNYKKRRFDEDAVEEEAKATSDYKKYDEVYAKKEAARNAAILEQARSDWREYVKEYGTFEDKKLAITEEYEKLINEAESEWQRKGLKNEMDKVLKEMELAKDEAYQNIFKDPNKMSSATINAAIDLAQSKLTEILSGGELSEEQLETVKTLREAIDKLQNYQDSSHSLLGGGLDGVIQKLNNLVIIRDKIAKAEKAGDEDALKALRDEEKKAKDSLKMNLAGTAIQGAIKGLGMVADSFREIAKITENMSLEELADQMDSLASSLNSAVQGFLQGGAIGMAINVVLDQVMKLFTAITDFVAFGAQNTKALKDYADEMKLLSLSIESSTFESIFGKDKWGEIKAAGDAWRKAGEELKKVGQIDLWESVEVTAGSAKTLVESAAKNGSSTSSLGNMWVQAKGIGKKKNSGFLNEMFPEIFDKDGNLNPEKIEEAKQALESLKNMKLADDSAVKALEDNIAVAEKLKENADLLKEAASDYMGNIAQSLGDVLVNSILRGEDAMDQLGAMGADIITQLGKDLATTWVLNSYLKQFEEPMQKAFENADENGVANVVAAIVEGFPNAMKTGTELVKQLYDTTKGTEYDVYEQARQQQEQQASQKGYATLSEETGSELSGRALAQYESNLRIEAAQKEQTLSVLEMKATLYSLLGQQLAITNIADDCRRILAETQIDVRAILDNTDLMVKPIANLSEKINQWHSKIMSL